MAGGPALPGLRAASPALRAALKKEPALAGEIEELLSRAGALFGCPAGDALFCTGFERGDATPGRLDAALAELGAALFLAGEGFTGLRPVPRTAGRTADLAARRGGGAYLFEVRLVRGGFGPCAAKKLSDKCLKKAAQLRSGLKSAGAGRGGLIFVGGLPCPGPFARTPGLDAAAAEVKVPARSSRLHVCLLSAAGSGVFPGWD